MAIAMDQGRPRNNTGGPRRTRAHNMWGPRQTKEHNIRGPEEQGTHASKNTLQN